MCSISVGRSYVVDTTDGSERKLPAGYDSIYLHTGEDAAPAEAASAGSAASPASAGEGYRHRYVTFDAAQALPRYVVHFTYDPREKQARRPIEAVDLSDIKSRIAETLAVLGPAAAAATEKMLTDIGDAYDAALAASQEADPLLDERRRSIKDALTMIDNKLAAIQSNSASVEEELYARMQAAMFALQDETQRKMNALLSEELELRRQLGAIDWNESFVKVMQETLPPMTFISAWERHAGLKSGLYAALGGRVSTSALDAIQPDMKLQGEIAIVCTAAATGRSASSEASSSSSPSAPVGAAGDVNEIWAAVLRDAVGGSAKPAASSTSSPSEAAVPAMTVEQAAASLAVAKANLSAIETTAASLPKDLRMKMEGAARDARQQVVAAERAYNDQVTKAGSAADKQAAAAATVAGGSTGILPSPISAAAATPAQQQQLAATKPPSTAAAPAPVAPVSRSMQAPLEQRVARFSLRREADRKRRQRGVEVDPTMAFPGSSILTPDQALTLYNCLPFGQAADDGSGSGGLGSAPPSTRLIFSTVRDGNPTIQGLLTSYAGMGNNEASVVLVRSNGQVFGGYAADPWDLSDYFGGSPKCFLFSLTRDTKIPYTGRVKGPKQANDDMLRHEWEMANMQAAAEFEHMVAEARMTSGADPEFDEAGRLLWKQVDPISGSVMVIPVPVPRPKPFIRHDCLKSNAVSIQFGVSDLVLSGDFTECSSDLEHSYGVGLRPDEAKLFMAGAQLFRAEVVEVWAITASTGNGSPSAAGNTGMMGMMTLDQQQQMEQAYQTGGMLPTGSMGSTGSSVMMQQQAMQQGYTTPMQHGGRQDGMY